MDVVWWTLAQPVAKLIRIAPHTGEQRAAEVLRDSGVCRALPVKVGI